MAGLLTGLTDAFGLTDSTAGQSELKESRRISKEAARLFADLDIPEIEKQKILLENPELVGLLEAEELGTSAMEEISLDPKMREAQLAALASLQEEGVTGLSVEDRFAADELRRGADAQAQAEQKAILSGMAQRGTLDSGAQLAAQLGAQQAGAQRRAEGSGRLAADASARRKQALLQSANVASGMEGAEFGRKSQQAQASDIINKFNVSNRQNIAAQNMAARQQSENQRAALANQQQMHNKALIQQEFQNQQSKLAGQTGQMQSQAAQLGKTGATMQQGAASGLGDVAKLASAGASLATTFSDVRLKEDIKPASNDLQDLLDKLSASKYTYKDDMGLPEGEQLGVMAQDLEKSELGEQFVEEDANGNKMVDYGKMGSTQMAALADLHDRLKKLEEEK